MSSTASAIPITAAPVTAATRSSRIVSVDLLRGLVMVVMALDHVRDYFSGAAYPAEDIAHTSLALFLTRVVTHFCAPVFFLLAGTGAYLSLSRGKSLRQVSYFFATRGLWLVALELIVIRLAWNFNLTTLPVAQVIWALGWAMVAMALLVWLPVRWIAAFGIGMMVFHDQLDRIDLTALAALPRLWTILHVPGMVTSGHVQIFIGYPLIPWVGVMAAGYALGALFRRPDRRTLLLWIGFATTAAFLIVRGINHYGNGVPGDRTIFPTTLGPWHAQRSFVYTVLSFFDTVKYPPSLDYLLMTLGPALILLSVLDRATANSSLGRIVIVFGRVPLFYYVVHIYLIHALAIVVAWLSGQPYAWMWQITMFVQGHPANYGHGLPVVYLMWAIVLAILYYPCRWYMNLKARHRDWSLLSYL
ncbi:MAG TPA: heparan-alpha-glucosaminide N-acetyltransferase domain-containing protein [Acidobacteriaceae bacterium]